MSKWVVLILLSVPFFAMADARFVEAPAECHVPYDNGDVDNEFKLQSCTGTLKSRGGGATYDAHVIVRKENLPGNPYVIDGEDVRDVETYPGGQLTIAASGTDSGTDCNIISNGTTYTTQNWQAATRIYRTQNQFRVNVEYDLTCTAATAQ